MSENHMDFISDKSVSSSARDPHAIPAGLKILIVGAGIAGLTAAIALRKNGHEVHVYEQSQLNNEAGVAIHVMPNSNGTLRRLGVDHEERGAIRLMQTRYFDSSCRLLSRHDNDSHSHAWQEPWLQAHRGQLHTHLHEVATSATGEGIPTTIHISSRAASVNAQNGTVTLINGERVHGDVVIGADGVRSVCRRAIAGPDYDSFPFGKNAFRFMVERDQLLEDSDTRELAEARGSLDMFFGPEHKFIMYPCMDNKWLSVTCIHPAQMSTTSSDTYNTSVSKEKMLEVFSEFDPRLLKIIEKCVGDTTKVWPLFDALDLPTFVTGRLALIGDAAHSFTPFIGQGGGMAIEDADSLGVMLTNGLSAAEVPQRLELYNLARHERATLVKGYSRVAGSDSVNKGDEQNARMKGRDHALYALSHDENHASTQILREFFWKSDPDASWRHPTAFGPIPRPRINDLAHSTSLASVTTARITFKTSATLLRNMFPTKSYGFVAADTVALASLSVRSHRNLDWLGLRGMNQVQFEIHGVRYTKTNGSIIHGSHVPVAFEDCTESIIANREDLSYPSVFSDIDIKDSQDSYAVRLSWRGIEWASMWLENLKTQVLSGTADNSASDVDEKAILVHKYTARTNGHGQGAGHHPSQDVLLWESRNLRTPNGSIDNNNKATGESGSYARSQTKIPSLAGFKFMPHNTQLLPTLHHIVARLAELPLFEVVKASLENTEGQNVTQHQIID